MMGCLKLGVCCSIHFCVPPEASKPVRFSQVFLIKPKNKQSRSQPTHAAALVHGWSWVCTPLGVGRGESAACSFELAENTRSPGCPCLLMVELSLLTWQQAQTGQAPVTGVAQNGWPGLF